MNKRSILFFCGASQLFRGLQKHRRCQLLVVLTHSILL